MATGFLASAPGGAATVEEALKYVPVQRDVEYDRPAAKDIAQCTIKSEKVGTAAAAWVVRGPAGEVLRCFADSNSDNDVDRWSYYLNGVECYRDIDSNFDGKADQYRWLGFAGSRWGIDDDQDGRIDRWKMISAEEVTAEVLGAIRDKDVRRFQLLLMTPAELSRLGLGKADEAQIASRLRNAPARFDRLVSASKLVDARTEWIHFGAARPGVQPSDTNGSTQDVIVYENVSAMIETAGENGQLAIGTLVRVDDLWRMIDVPTGLLEEEERLQAGYFFKPSLNDVAAAQPPEGEMGEELQKLMTELDSLQKKLQAAATPEAKEPLYAQMVVLLRHLASKAATPQDQAVWVRQLADTLSTAAQAGEYSQAQQKLAALHKELAAQAKSSRLTAYVLFRKMTTDYSIQLADPNANFNEIQEGWLKKLEAYVAEYPESDDTAEAILQLAIAEEFAGSDDKALAWYDRILQNPQSDALVRRKAAGARRRITGVGKPLELSGKTTEGQPFNIANARGNYVLVHYWATWCPSCIEDIKNLDKLLAKYGGKFLPVGINLDSDDKALADFLRQNRLEWPQLHEQGGLDGRLAVELGILTVPTMILVDDAGQVVNRNIHIAEVESYLSKNLN
jgi:thiol-disulfide isomerase/thioredoxin